MLAPAKEKEPCCWVKTTGYSLLLAHITEDDSETLSVPDGGWKGTEEEGERGKGGGERGSDEFGGTDTVHLVRNSTVVRVLQLFHSLGG